MASAPPHDHDVSAFSMSELSLHECKSVSYLPFRAKLCQTLCEAFKLDLKPTRPALATRTDLGQYHADNYLALLQISSDLWVWRAEKSSKRLKLEGVLVKDRLHSFNLHLPDIDQENAIFPGMFTYVRLYTSGTLGSCQMLMDGQARIALNWAGGHTRAHRSYACGGCFVNDSVLGCLYLLNKFERVLHISVDHFHSSGVEEAFYTTDRVMTMSFHDSSINKCGLEEDMGHSKGAGYAVNVPLSPACFTDESFTPLFEQSVRACVEWYSPDVVVLVLCPSIIAGDRFGGTNMSLHGYVKCFEMVRNLDLPLLVLGGGGSNIPICAKAWCAVTARCVGRDVIGEEIPQDCPFRDHFWVEDYRIVASSRAAERAPPDDDDDGDDEIESLKHRLLERFSSPPLKSGETPQVEGSVASPNQVEAVGTGGDKLTDG